MELEGPLQQRRSKVAFEEVHSDPSDPCFLGPFFLYSGLSARGRGVCRSVTARSEHGVGGVETNIRVQRHVVLLHVAGPEANSAAAQRWYPCHFA